MLGAKYTGKTSTANTILGHEEFDTTERTALCMMGQGEVLGRQVTVVDTPGWWDSISLDRCPSLTKREILFSVSLCSPGLQVFLLVIHGNVAFTAEHRDVVQQHVEYLSDEIWNHTVVIFTHGDRIGDATIEQYIECEGGALQWLVEKCGNRYHVLNNSNLDDDGQISELLEKIEEMFMGNRGCHYELDSERLQVIENKRREQEEMAKERMSTVQKQRATLREQMGE